MEINTTNKYPYAHRVVLAILLFTIVLANYFGEHVILCDGYGWDGCSYYKDIVINGLDEYLSNSISYYHTHRMLPFLIIHYLMKMFGISQTAQNVMNVSSTINVILLFASVFFFFRISNKLKWQKHVEILAFTFSFYNFHVLKFMGYCPVMTDMPTFAICWASACCFIENRTRLLTFLATISMFIFPLLSFIIFLLIIMPRQEIKEGMNKFSSAMNIIMKTILVAWLPLAFILYIVFRYKIRGVNSINDVFIARYPENIYIAMAGTAAYIAFYYFAAKPLEYNWKEVFNVLIRLNRLKRTIMATVLFVVLYHIPQLYGFKGPFSLVNELAQICQFPATDILIFIETHFLYLGVYFIFIMLYWRDICLYANKLGTGYFILMIMALFFLPDIETRKTICFFVFIIIPLMNGINNRNETRKGFVCIIVALQLAISFFWLNINTVGTEESFYTYSVDTYMQWPAQRYYMFQGPWQSHQVYRYTLLAEAILTLSLWLYTNNKRIIAKDYEK